MFDSLFGAGTPLAVKFFIAFVVVFALIGLTAWLIRRFGAGRLGTQTARGRQPRLAVIDAAPVDGRRRLVLIRRDNIEHLLMIGGPSDVVVETNIVRASAANRESISTRGTATATPAIAATATAAAPAPAAVPEALPRAVPLAEAALWPLQPEPLPRSQRRAIAEETVHWPLPAEPGSRGRGADPLSGLAAELARSAPKAGGAPFNGGRVSAHDESDFAAPEPHAAAGIEDDMPAPPEAPPPPPLQQAAPSPADQNLAEMAQRLEAALRRPPSAAEPRPAPRAGARRPENAAAMREGNGATRHPPREEPKPEPRAERESKPESKPDAAGSPFPSLEQEMASLLGRPPGKT